ncbi:hypothetical protein F946_03289 [Acinetobacter johnsonii ANC 3681]|uniref:Acyl-ACP thioesterase-like C-terminal domain-containing protein n=1 Tax=Acinetobacter johnsonii ANC 3681 TaxID=1217662 RepID=N9BC78_ACIJO|nr:hypothetical protein F946_03289 [Acinetobacter johnsonii ANC 3681]
MRQAAKTRDQFHYFLPIQTRWSDNDLYGHVNNVTYYSQTTLLSIQDSKKNRNNSSTDLYWFYNNLTI